LGLCVLADALAASCEVQVYDGLTGSPAELVDAIKQFNPDLVGLGIRNIDNQDLLRPTSYVPSIRNDFMVPIRQGTEAPVVLGGSGYSLFPDELLAFLQADFGVVGPGEALLPQLVEAPFPSGVIRGEDAGATPRRPMGGPPRSARIDHWIDFAPYRVGGPGTFPVQTTRGCRQRCTYCTYPHVEGASLRLRPPQSVVEEIAGIRDRLGPVTIEFVDSVFNDPVDHAEALCHALAQQPWRCRLRTMGLNPRGVTPRLLALMQKAGFAQIDCTPDSASPEMLRRLAKGFDRESLERTATLISQAKVPTMWFFLFGGPGETEGTFRESLDFIDRFVAPEDMVLMAAGLRIYRGTGLHRQALKDGLVVPGQSLLEPLFYVSPLLGRQGCIELVEGACATRPHCVPLWEATPSPAMVRHALELRKRQGLDEPMFRTLLHLRRDALEADRRTAEQQGAP
jgi:pyruvate-formate lyase-activating enzyme